MQKKINTSFILLIILILALLYFSAKTLFAIFLPFIIAYLLSKMTNPLMRLLHNHIKLPNWVSAMICTLLVVALFLLIVTGIGMLAYKQFLNLYDNWESIAGSFKNQYSGIFDKSGAFYSGASDSVKKILDTLPGAVDSYVNQLAEPVLEFAKTFATKLVDFVPQFFIAIIITFLSCYFISRDPGVISKGFEKLFGNSFYSKISFLCSQIKRTVGGYIKTQLILMAIVFVILSAGLGIAGVDYFLLIALGIAILDALPVFGSGMVLIPWGLWMLLHANIKGAVILVALYLVILLSRRILEPKILGDHIGLHPIWTLISMYAGFKLFGIIGMIAGPIIAVIIQTLIDADVFKKLKELS